MMTLSNRLKGIILAVGGSIFWGMLIGGAAISLIYPPLSYPGTLDRDAILSLAYICLLGTAISFWAYVSSTKYILPQEASILNALGIYNPYIIHLFHLLHITTPYFFTALFFQILLYWLYCNGYKSETALSIMGTIPLVIIALILPFLKVMHFDGMMGDAHTVDVTPHDNVIPPPDGYHHVNGYWRTMPNGHTEYVHSYIRSNPDGIIENNLSSGYFPHDSSITHTTMYNSEAHMPNVFLTKMYYSVTDFLTLKKPSVLSITFLGMLINCITTVILFAILL